MSITYNASTNFGAKDALPPSDPAKVIYGSEFTTEFEAISSAFGEAAPTANPSFTGTATFDTITASGDVTANKFIGDGSELQNLPAGSQWLNNGDDIYYNDGRVGIGGEPSRSTKEIEDEAVATLANWDSKDKKPTKAELIKRLTERNIGGGVAKLQVAGDGYFSGNLNAKEIVVDNASAPHAQILLNESTNPLGKKFLRSTNGSFDIVSHDYTRALFVLDDGGNGYFPGRVDANKLGVISGDVERPSHSGVHFSTDFWVPIDSTGGLSDAKVDLGNGSYRFKDGHFSGTVNALDVKTEYVYNYGVSGLKFEPNAVISLNSSNSTSGGTVDLGTASNKWKDAHFGGIIGTLAIQGYVSGKYGLSFNDNSDKTITPIVDGAAVGGQVSLGNATRTFKDAYFTGTVDAGGFTVNGNPLGGGLPDGGYTYGWNITAADFISTSDERLKDNITPMPIGLIDDIKPVSWDWKDGGGKSAGVVAQQLQAVGLGDYVHENEDGQLGVNYQALTAILLAEVIDLKRRLK